MEMIDILAKLREYERAGQSVGDAIKSTEKKLHLHRGPNEIPQ